MLHSLEPQRSSVEELWKKLASNIREILHNNIEMSTFAESYYLGYKLMCCLRPQGPLLYNGVRDLLVENLDRLAKEIIFPVFPSTGRLESDLMKRRLEDEGILEAVYTAWSDYTDNVKKVSHILTFLNDRYVRPAHLLGVVDLGRDLFVKHIIRPPIKDHIINAILGLLYIERKGYVINRSAIKNCVDTLIRLSDNSDGITIYKRDVEPQVLRQTEAYYEAKARELLETCGTLEYLRRVQTCFSDEESRIHQCFPSQTFVSLQATSILENTLLAPHWQTLIDVVGPGLDTMIDLDRLDELSLQFSMTPVEALFLSRFLKTSIQRRGTELNRISMEGREPVESGCPVGDRVDPPTQGSAKTRPRNASPHGLAQALRWVEDVMQLKDQFDRIWKVSFRSHPKLEVGLKEGFESFINVHPRASEFISLYIDDNMKNGLKGKTDAEVEVVLDKGGGLFKFITEKDVFERYYKVHLARRLLHNRSANDDAERDMLSKFKVECGFQFTVKLEGMFHDMKLSTDIMQAYRDHLSRTTAPGFDINVTVMTSTFWPMSYARVSYSMPPLLAKACKSFEQFYLSRHSGRKLTWQLSLGNADVQVTFKARKHDLNVSSFALAILLLFEDVREGEFLTYEEIKTVTSIPDSELQRNLQSLACTKFKVLRKHPDGRDINPDDSFSFNADFSSPLRKIKITTVPAQIESDEEQKETQRGVKEERRYQIDACIVRIMKDRKRMTHNGLVNEVTIQLTPRFLPDPMDIKKRIEALIEREYLERREDRKSYNYLA